MQVGVGVPERNRIAAGDADRAQRVTVVEAAGKGHDAHTYRHAHRLPVSKEQLRAWTSRSAVARVVGYRAQPPTPLLVTN